MRGDGHRRAAGLVLAAALAGVVVCWAPGGAGATTSFTATASADVLHVSYFVQDAPLAENVVDAGSPSAATALDDVGNSTAQAAAAYPGDTVADNPGTVRGVLPVPAPVPDVPFIASSRYPSPASAEQTAGPYALSAKSDPQGSTADASGTGLDQGGIAIGRAAAHAVSRTDGTKVTASSSNDAGGLDGQALRIAVVHSAAQVVYDGTRKTPTSEFAVSGASIAGTAVDIGPHGVTVAGQDVPLPPASPLLQVLADQGVHVRYLAPVVTPSSVLSAGLQIDQEVPAPPGAPVGTTTQTIVLGRSSAALSNVSAGAAPAAVPVAPPVDRSAPAAPAPAPAGEDAPAPVDAPAAVDVAAPAAGPVPDTSGLPPELPAAGPVASRLAAARSLPRALDLYPPFVVGAVGLLLVSQASRLLGVRRP